MTIFSKCGDKMKYGNMYSMKDRCKSSKGRDAIEQISHMALCNSDFCHVGVPLLKWKNLLVN